MKGTFSVILLFISFIGFCQTSLKESDVKTTIKEYDFLTKKYGSEDNFKMLDGYEFKSFFGMESENYSYNYKLFIESNTQKVKAILILVSKVKKGDNKIKYLCMPINNDVLFEKFINKAWNLGMTSMSGFFYTGSILLTKFINNQYNSNDSDLKTTTEEYNFLSKKYGVDANYKMLDGYILNPFHEETIRGKLNFKYNLFIELRTKNVKAVLITVSKLKKHDNKTRFYCMPINNNELMLKFYENSYKIIDNESIKLALCSKYIDNNYNLK
jgi:hypothetical protein